MIPLPTDMQKLKYDNHEQNSTGEQNQITWM